MKLADRYIALITARQLTWTTPTRRWTVEDLNQALTERLPYEVRISPDKEPLRGFIAEREVLVFEAGIKTTYSTPNHPTLLTIRDFASTKVDPAYQAPPGKRSSRQVDRLSGKQMERCDTVANKVARDPEVGCPDGGLRSAMSRVRGDIFDWDPKAEDWSNFIAVIRRVSDPSTLTQDISTGRLLLDFAASEGLLHRAPSVDPGHAPIPAEWSSTHNEWRTAIRGVITEAPKGIRGLLQAVADLRMTPDSAEWNKLIPHLERTFKEDDIDSHDRSVVRAAYRALRAAGLLTGPDWDARADQKAASITPVTQACIRSVASLYGVDEEHEGWLDPADTVWPGFEPLKALVDGPLGLRSLALYLTVPHTDAPVLGLPARGVYPRDPIRDVSGMSYAPLRIPSLQKTFALVLQYAGWLMAANEWDFSTGTNGLLLLLDERNLLAMREAVVTKKVVTRGTWRRMVAALARLASPFCEASALRQERAARGRGDRKQADQWHVVADRMAYASAMLHSNRLTDDALSWHTQLVRDAKTSVVQRIRAKAEKVERYWTQGQAAGSYAYQQFERVREALITSLELETEISGSRGHGLASQAIAIQSGWVPSRTWARDVRDVLYWQDQLIAPMRVATSCKMDMAERLHTDDFAHIFADIDASKFKVASNGNFSGNYYCGGGHSYNPWLYGLYVMPGGARDILRTDSSGQLHDRDAFYVPDATRTDNRRMTNRAFRNAVKRMVKRVARGLGLSYHSLRRGGALGTHFFRHGFGTFMVRMGLLAEAKAQMHHSSLDMLTKVYSANGAQAIDIGRSLERLRGARGL